MYGISCKDCGKPVYWSEDAEGWYHDNLPDVLACPALDIEPVEAEA